MAFLSSLNIAASGMAAERLRLDVISQNVANAKTTRTEDGTPYRRQVVLFSENKGFNSVLEETIAKRKEKIAGGVPAQEPAQRYAEKAVQGLHDKRKRKAQLR